MPNITFYVSEAEMENVIKPTRKRVGKAAFSNEIVACLRAKLAQSTGSKHDEPSLADSIAELQRRVAALEARC